jgi:hypothetical protein
MNLFQEQGVRDYAAAAAQIPVIDFGPCFAGQPGARERTAEVVRHACENVGFFYALNHGVPDAVVERAFAASPSMPAARRKLKLRLNENNIGYLPVNASVQGASTVHKATRRTRTRASSSATTAVPTIPTSSQERRSAAATNGRQANPGLRRDMMAYFQALGAMCTHPYAGVRGGARHAGGVFAPFFAPNGTGEGPPICAFCITRRSRPTKTICSARRRIPTTAS